MLPLNSASNWRCARGLSIVWVVIVSIQSWRLDWERCRWSVLLLLVQYMGIQLFLIHFILPTFQPTVVSPCQKGCHLADHA
jgi:hypothetical protein